MVNESTQPLIRIAICDDDPLTLDWLRQITRQALSPGYQIEILLASSPQALLALKENLQIAVLDIQLPQCNGIELAETIMRQHPACSVIFVSGYVNYVSDVYRVPHLGMVLKDQVDVQLPKFLTRAASAAAQAAGQAIVVHSAGKNLEIPLAELRYMERRGHYTYIHLRGGGEVLTKEKLGELQARIGNAYLCRCHISYLVNLYDVRAIGDQSFELHDGSCIPISRSHSREAREAFFQYLTDTT